MDKAQQSLRQKQTTRGTGGEEPSLKSNGEGLREEEREDGTGVRGVSPPFPAPIPGKCLALSRVRSQSFVSSLTSQVGFSLFAGQALPLAG